jgi:hypothetical protein
MNIYTEKITVAVAGSAGAGAGSQKSGHPINGKLLAVYVDYVTQPATTDVTIATESAPVKTLLTITSANADGWFYPRYIIHSEAAAALTGTAGGDRAPHPIDDYVTVTVAEGDPGSVIVYVVYER